MKTFCTILIAVTLLFVLVGQAAERRFKVNVEISCDDPMNKRFIESHIKRELRSLGDVDITNRKNAQFHVLLVVMELHKGGQKTTAIAIAGNYLLRFDMKDWQFVHKQSKKVIDLHDITELFFKPELTLQVGDVADLDKICKSIIVTFDLKVLETYRPVNQE